LKPAWANSSRDSILKKIHYKKGLVEWLKVKALSSNPSTTKKKKKLKQKGLGHESSVEQLPNKHEALSSNSSTAKTTTNPGPNLPYKKQGVD
jgi:hypothetical protein